MNIDKNEFRKYAVGHCYVPSATVDKYLAHTEKKYTHDVHDALHY